MQTRRDQLQAYRYLLRRIMSAMLGGNPESPEQPMRRLLAATFSGVMVAVIAGAGVGLYGWLAGGSTRAWRQPGTLVVEKQTGTRYLYLHGVLHPVVNYTSARLILGTEPHVVRASRESLAGVRHGPPVGIPGAPDALPPASAVRSAPWAVCSQVGDSAAGPLPTVDVVVGHPVRDSRPLGERAVVVAANSQLYLVWHGKRLLTSNPALRALGLKGEPLPVGAAWLDALPAGSPLRAPVVPVPARTDTPPVGGRATFLGQVFRTENVGTGPEYEVMLGDGLASINQTQAALVLGRQESPQSQPTVASPSDLGAATRSAQDVSSADLPPSPPRTAGLASDPTAPLCASYAGSGARLRLTTGGRLPAATADQPGGTASGPVADHVRVPTGRVAVVGARPAPGVAPDVWYLVTENGVAYAVPSKDVLRSLGYAGVHPLALPEAILDLVPRGPTLDPQAAARPAPLPTGPSEPAPAPTG